MITTSDGIEVEITFCDAAYPPGGYAGIACGLTVCWVRLKGGSWFKSRFRSSMRTAHEIKRCPSADLESSIGEQKEIEHDISKGRDSSRS